MNSIAVFQFYPSEDAGYLADFLDERGIPWHYIRVDQGQSIPTTLNNISAMIMMGGPMSVNDDLVWIPPLLNLIRQAQDENIPMIGHCLGGQLIAKALGAQVHVNKVREIGWGSVTPTNNDYAKAYFGEKSFQAFHWHGETFDLPKKAVHLLSSPYCQNQAFAIGNTLAMQCHIEMTNDMITEWCISDAEYHAQGLATSPAVQSLTQIEKDTRLFLPLLKQQAITCYEYWLTKIHY